MDKDFEAIRTHFDDVSVFTFQNGYKEAVGRISEGC